MLSPKELKALENYEAGDREQLATEREYAERPFLKSSLAPLLDVLEAEAAAEIRDASEEIGVFMKCKETFKGRAVSDMANYFMTLAKYRIEAAYDDITRWREIKAEHCRV